MLPGGSPTRIEIDVARQVLFQWVNGSLARILTVSTGNNERYCVDGECSVKGAGFMSAAEAVAAGSSTGWIVTWASCWSRKR